MSASKKEIVKLNEQLIAWSDHYYNKANSLVQDQVYDAVYQEYKMLVAQYPQWEPENSILKQVGAQASDNRFAKVKHQFPMLSLNNAFNPADLQKFDKQIKTLLNYQNDIEYFLEYKIDGISIALLYDQGHLVKAITRGDGIVGEDVTHNVKQINDIPHQIPFLKPIEFRGEIFMSHQVFKKLNQEGANLANPRNAAAGSLRQLDSAIVKTRNLSSFIYAIPNPLAFNLKSQEELLQFIKKCQLNVNPHAKKFTSIEKLIKQIDTFTNKRTTLDYEVDGLVVKVNNITWHEDIGFTVKFPKFMIAYKFPAEIAETKLLDIFPTIGRTGRVTYNAKLLPVRLAGTTVAAATLHNADYILQAKINVGDFVKVKKAGDIIPKVLGVAKKVNAIPWKESALCPVCNHQLVRLPEEVDQYCINENCPAIILAKMEHFVSRNALNIEGLSAQQIKKFYELALIKDLADIFMLAKHQETILKLEGYQAKSVANLLKAIDKAKIVSLDKFIFGLGIRHVGQKNARILANRFNDLNQIMTINVEEVEKIRDLGPKVASSLVSFWKDQSNQDLVKKMLAYGLTLTNSQTSVSTKLENLTFVITGTLSKSRNEFKTLIESHGGNVASAISAKTNFLLIGKEPGSKLTKAEALNVKILSETKLMAMIGE